MRRRSARRTNRVTPLSAQVPTVNAREGERTIREKREGNKKAGAVTRANRGIETRQKSYQEFNAPLISIIFVLI